MPGPSATTSTLSAARSRAYPLVGLAGREVVARVEDSAGSGEPAGARAVCFLHGLVGLNDHWDEVVRRIAHRLRCTMLELPLLQLQDEDCSIHGATALTVRFLEEYYGLGAGRGDAGKRDAGRGDAGTRDGGNGDTGHRTQHTGVNTTDAGPRARDVGRPGVILVGNSFGGHVALKIAIDRPDLVSGLVLAGASGLIEKSMVSDVQIRPSKEWMTRKIGELFFDLSKMNPADVDRAHQELSRREGARAMVRLSRSARRNHLGGEIGRITAPTLVIWGKQDVVTPPEAAEQFLAEIKGSKIVWLDRCGHAPMIEKPDEFAAAMLEFVGGSGGVTR